MSLAPGTRLGAYEITAPIGAGGMGEVYRARDTKLNRDVAIKVLPEVFANDPERLSRFTREAQTLASLNHPNIAHIHGLEESPPTSSGQAGVRALVMELVEGEDLSQRIARSRIPLEEALPIARQIAEALEAAHEHGIIHRDLKPANIKLTADGKVKVLDFGLAKVTEPAAGSAASMSLSPTITSPALTQAGIILGTAAYMSPEQARGKPVDRRADIWAFGCVLYEMLSGRRPFEDEDVSLTLSNVLQREPDFEALPSALPAGVRQALRVCLRKDPKQRVSDIRDVLLAIEGGFDRGVEQTRDVEAPRSASSGLWKAATVVCLLAAAIMSVLQFRENPQPQQTLRYQIPAPAENETIVSFDISPDGRQVAFVTGRYNAPRFNRLWVRPLDSLEAQPLQGTEGAGAHFWSPDSRMIAFFSEGQLKKIDLIGGPPRKVVDGGSQASGAWNRDDTILFTGAEGPLHQVNAAGGQAQPVTALDTSRQEMVHYFPQFLPDGRHFLYTAISRTGANNAVYAGSLDSKETKRLLASNARASYTHDATGQGYLLFVQGETLLAQRFDGARLDLQGEPFLVAESVEAPISLQETSQVAQFSSSAGGVLTYKRAGTAIKELVWFTRLGQRLSTVGEPADYSNPALSPDERRLAISQRDAKLKTRDIWMFDLERGGSNRLTFDRSDESGPIWSPDNQRIAFDSNRSGPRGLYVKDANGTSEDEPLWEPNNKTAAPVGTESAHDWAPDGQFILTTNGVLPLGGERKLIPMRVGSNRAISPNGRWLAYHSEESGGRVEVYVQSLPELRAGRSTGKQQVSTAGGSDPEWRRDGQELYYLAPDNQLMAVSVKADGPVFETATPTRLFPVRIEPANRRAHYQPAANGQRFLVVQLVEQSNPITVVVNWAAGLTQ